MPLPSKVPLLIVEDDTNIRVLLEAAAQRSQLFEPIMQAPDGQAALEMLRALSPADLPGLIASDLSMPRMNGLELLRSIKADERLRHINVGIITSSNVPNDRELAMAAGACSFVHKPHGLNALMRAIVSIRASCAAEAGAANSV
jgi:chemosensory pili system protein ChpA (sensor histidine kinase/response regulator)